MRLPQLLIGAGLSTCLYGAAAAQAVSTASGDLAAQTPAPAAAAPVDQPDIAQTFRKAVAAVVGSGGSRRVLVTQARDYGHATRRLKVGDEFQDGWIIKTLEPQRVVLSRAGQVREVDLTTGSDAAGTSGKSTFTFASLGLTPPPPPPPEEDVVEAQAQPAVDPALVQAVAQAIVQMQAPAADAAPPQDSAPQ